MNAQIQVVPGDLMKCDHCHVVIYGLVDPNTQQIRYVGKTRQKVSSRLSAHLRERSKCHRLNWIKSLQDRGQKPEIIILEEIFGAWPWEESERYWIAHGRAEGWPLTNNTSGGDGVRDLSAETRERMRQTWLGRKHSPDAVEKIRALKTGVKASDETRAKMSRSHRGRKIQWIDTIADRLRKLSADQIAEIKERLFAGTRVGILATEFGVHRTTLSKIKAGTYLARNQGSKRTAERAQRSGTLLDRMDAGDPVEPAETEAA